MSKTKFAFLYKYIFLLAILALLFSVSFSFARYATSASNATGVNIDEFNIDVHLYHESVGTYEELIDDTLPSVSVFDLTTYTDTYCLTITNNDRYTLSYSFSEKEDNFIFSSVTEYSKTESTSYTQVETSSPKVSTYVGEVEPKGTDGATTLALKLQISVNPSVSISPYGQEQELAINFYLEYQHTETYERSESLSIDSSMDGSTLSGDYYLTSDLYLTSGLKFDGTSTLSLNGHTISGDNSSSSNLNLISVASGASLTIEDYGSISGGYNALYLNSGSSCQVTGGTITNAYNSGVYVASGASLTLSGSPVITGSGLAGTDRNVYFFGSNDTITLGELKEGANIGVSKLAGTGQITSTETGTYKYEDAIKYIHADGSSYKVVAGHSGYLSLVSHSLINFTVALHGTSGSTHNIPSSNQNGDFNGAFNIDGGSVTSSTANKDSGWKGADSSYFSQQSLSSYSGTYAYDYYYDFGSSVSSNLEFTFAVCPYTWESSLYDNGLAPSSSDFSTQYKNASNFYLWANQHNAGTEEQGWDDYTASMWGLEFNNMTTDVMDGIGDFTIVLELDYSSLDTSWSSDNNIVSNVYFIVDGVTQSLSN